MLLYVELDVVTLYVYTSEVSKLSTCTCSATSSAVRVRALLALLALLALELALLVALPVRAARRLAR